ncbi:MAG: hypothetical protein RBT74_05305 [Tenuifilaceae bacterium]|jgi:hypothetical protein|nr:hypothetical protein [Tenuifilaceae bacterium]
MERTLRISAVILLLTNSLGALWGGAGLIYDPSGEFMQMPLDFLTHTPFKSYLIPGIILLVVNGTMCLAAAILTIRRWKYHPQLITLQGILLAGWLSIQIMMIQVFYAPLHLPFYLIALALIVVGSVLLRAKQVHPKPQY